MRDDYKKDYLNADLVDLKEKFGDNRGFIQPLCDLNMKSASLIYTKPDQWRANHYHKEDWHFIYVIKGEFEYYFKKTNSEEKIQKKMKDVGLTIVPLRLFLSEKGWAKLEIAVAKGKKLHDKRNTLKDRDVQRDIDRAKK